MDLNTARHVLRLDPLAPLTAEAVETAYAREAWARHPSRYPDAGGFEAATAWAGTLAEAREVLLQSAPSTDATSWAPPAISAAPPQAMQWATPAPSAVPTPIPSEAVGLDVPPVAATASTIASMGSASTGRRDRRRVGLVVGIVAASAGVIALIGGAAFGATRLAEQLVDDASALAEDPWLTGETVRYSADEMLFTFPAAVEEYYDGRYSGRCPAEYDFGCWEMAIITEASCASLEVDIEFTNDEAARVGDEQEILAITDVAAGAATPVVFGHNEYDWAWIADVRCLDARPPAPSGASTTESAVSTPMARLEAGRWTSEDTGFYVLASLEVHDDGRLDELCPDGFERGCWQTTIVPEAACGRLRIQYSFRAEDGSEMTQATWRTVEAGEPVNVVFGHDEYEYGWISHVACLS